MSTEDKVASTSSIPAAENVDLSLKAVRAKPRLVRSKPRYGAGTVALLATAAGIAAFIVTVQVYDMAPLIQLDGLQLTYSASSSM